MRLFLLWIVLACSFSFALGVSTPVLDIFERNLYDWPLEELVNESWDIVWRQKSLWLPEGSKLVKIWELPEEEIAVIYLHEIWATIYDSSALFRWHDLLSREQAAKLLMQWWRDVDELVQKDVVDCDFTDLTRWSVDETLIADIEQSCDYWIFAWYEWKFMPKENIKRWHFFLAVLRVLWFDVTESEVYETASTIRLTHMKLEDFWYEDEITRTDASLILLRAAMKRLWLIEFLDGPYKWWTVFREAESIESILTDLYSDEESVSMDISTTTSDSPLPKTLPKTSWWGGTIAVDTTPLKWWEIDDNIHYDDFIKYYTEAQSEYWDVYSRVWLDKRYHIVSSKKGTLSWVELKITDSTGKIYYVTLDNDWEYYFYPDSYLSPHSEASKEISWEGNYEVEMIQWEQVNKMNFLSSEQERILSYESVQIQENKSLQLAFVIDTTWSMSDQINKIKNTLESVVQRVSEEIGDLHIEYGLVAYRDKTDAYVTSAYQFTSDLEAYMSYLEKLSAQWWGDYEEDMNAWLEEAMEYLDWSSGHQVYGLAFLVADAPPHMDYNQTYDYPAAMLRAVEQWIKIFPLASSWLDNTVGELVMRQIALITNATYMFITKWANWWTDYHVDEQSYSVETLDDLLVDVIVREVK